jgi:hypothetical protein
LRWAQLYGSQSLWICHSLQDTSVQVYVYFEISETNIHPITFLACSDPAMWETTLPAEWGISWYLCKIIKNNSFIICQFHCLLYKNVCCKLTACKKHYRSTKPLILFSFCIVLSLSWFKFGIVHPKHRQSWNFRAMASTKFSLWWWFISNSVLQSSSQCPPGQYHNQISCTKLPYVIVLRHYQ